MSAAPVTTALVTGASRGIGAAVARAFAAQGARVALVARGAAPLEALAAELGAGAIAVPCDVTDASAVAAMAETVTRAFGATPDVVVNNAGIFRMAPVAAMSAELFTESVRVNLVAPFLLVRAFLSGMLARRSGHVITIGSVADRTVLPDNGAYAPAKFGLRAFHEVLRAEVRGTGVRATIVSPSATDTPLWDEPLAGDRAATLPSRDVMLPPSAVAEAVLYAVRQPAGVNIDELRLSHA